MNILNIFEQNQDGSWLVNQHRQDWVNRVGQDEVDQLSFRRRRFEPCPPVANVIKLFTDVIYEFAQ
jgi:hypothetical protein